MEEKTAAVESNSTAAKSDLGQEASLPIPQPAVPETQGSPTVPKKNKSFKAIIIGVILLVILAAIGYFLIFPQNKKIYHVGILSALNLFDPAAEGFKEGMKNLGYIEGKNIVYDIHKLPTENDKEMKKVLDGFVVEKVDLIVVGPTSAALKAKSVAQSTNIPVVFASAYTDGNSLIESVTKPGGNITGVRWPSSSELAVKKLEILHEMVPQAKRLWVAYEKDYPSMSDRMNALRLAVKPLGMTLVEVPVKSVADINTDLQMRGKLKDIGIDAIMIGAFSFGSPESVKAINKFAEERSLPGIGPDINSSVFSLGPDPSKSGEQAAYLADKVLKGIRAGIIPVVSANNLLTINYKLTQKLGLTVPEGLLSQADKIIR
jgi:putative tryptophan/tyrosine transport system substrate-binding protein